MDDTLRFASRLCKFIVAASFLLVAVASLCLWWTGQAYEYAALALLSVRRTHAAADHGLRPAGSAEWQASLSARAA